MKKLSLQIRLILSFICIAGTVWLAAAGISWYEGRDKLDEFFDTYQLLLSRQLASADWHSLTPETQKRIDKIINSLDDDGEEEDDALGFAIFNQQGQMIFHDGQDGKIFPFNSQASGFVNQPIGNKGKIWRILWVKTSDRHFTIAVGQQMEFRNDAALDLVEETLLPWLFGLTILLLAAIYMIRREFKPLQDIAKNLRHRSSEDLSPLDGHNLPSEILPLANALNQLFERINTMLLRERSFISDSAHELRSPLTALKVQLEVAHLAEDDASTRKEALNKLNQGIERASRLVEQLLALSRLEAFSNHQEQQNLDWPQIINASFNEHHDMAKNQKISLNFNTDNSTLINKGYPLLCSLLLRNLLDNALRYSPSGAKIIIEIKDHQLHVTNTNVKVETQYLPRLSERFFRPPGQTQSGSGLGLSIVERIAKLHDCSCSFQNTTEGFKVSIIPH